MKGSRLHTILGAMPDRKYRTVNVSNPDTGLAKARYRGVFQIPPLGAPSEKIGWGSGVSDAPTSPKKWYPGEFDLPFHGFIKLDQGQRNYGDTMALAGPVTHKRHAKKNWEGCACIVYHTCMKKREIIDKREKRPSKHGHGGLHQL